MTNPPPSTIDPLNVPPALAGRLRKRAWWVSLGLSAAAAWAWWEVGWWLDRQSRSAGAWYEALSLYPLIFAPSLPFLLREHVEGWLVGRAYKRAVREGRWPA